MPGVPSRIADARIADRLDPDVALVALRGENLPLVERWLHAEHVRRWWSHPVELEMAEIARYLEGGGVAPFLAWAEARPIGYLQIYHANPEEFWARHELPIETFGLDLFIGEADALGRGCGPRLIRLALRRLFAMPEVARVHIDPDPANAAAIRAYEKAGFRKAGKIGTPDGPALYMTFERQGAGCPPLPPSL